MSDPGERSVVRRVFLNGRERRLRAGWRLLAAMVALALAVVLIGLVIGVVQSVVAAVLPLSSVGVLQSTLSYQLLSNVVVTGTLVAVAWFVDVRRIADLGLGGRDWWPNLAVGLVLGVVMTTTVFTAELAAGLVTIRDVFVVRPAFGIGTLPFWAALALTFALFVAVGVGEEVIFRGYFMTNVAEGLNGLGPVGPRAALATAAFLTSAVFGVVHITNPNATPVSAANITVVGLFLAWAYVVTEDLGISIGVHVTWNFSLSSVYGFPVSGLTTPATVLDVRQTGDPLITGGPFGPEAGLVVYLSLAVAVAVTWWWVRRTRGPAWFPIGVAVPDLRKSSEASAEAE